MSPMQTNRRPKLPGWCRWAPGGADWDSYPDDPDFIVLEGPDGNQFCIVDLTHEQA